MRTAGTSRGPRPLTSSSLLALLTLLAVFAMHGPSSGHSMLMPMSQHATAGAGTSPAEHETHDADRVGGAHVGATDVVMSGRAQLLGPGAQQMAHGECIATLRTDLAQSRHVDVVVTTTAGAPMPERGRAPTRFDGGPPPRPPDLERLCISRT